VTSTEAAPAPPGALRILPHRHFAGTRRLATNGGALALNVFVSGATGLVFWVLAARVAPPSVVAQASTALGAIVAVVSLTQQSFVFTLPSLLAVSPRPKALAAKTYAVALVITAAVAPVYVFVGPSVASGLNFLRDGRLAAAVIFGCLVWCVFSLQDSVLTGVRRGGLVLFENAAWGASRLAVVFALWALGVRLGVGWLVASWIVPAAVAAVAVTWFLFRSASSPLRGPLGMQALERRRYLSFMGTEYLASVLSSVVALVGGAYAITTLGASGAAPFVTAVSLVSVMEGSMASFAQALAVEASQDAEGQVQRRNMLRLTALVLGAVSVVAVAAALVFGHQIMGMLGDEYRASGGTAFAILSLCLPARAIAVVSNADNRIRSQGGRNLLQQVVACVVFFGLLLTGQVTTIAAICWAAVAMRFSSALVATQHLRVGRLQLSTP
jgi:O-antigen/teichoic acid export membrane protein